MSSEILFIFYLRVAQGRIICPEKLMDLSD
jgi:hypothetical protein